MPDIPPSQLVPNTRARRQRARRRLLGVTLLSLLLLGLLTGLLWLVFGWIGRMFGYQGNDANLPVTAGLALTILAGVGAYHRSRLRSYLQRP
ncbi:hypothetical protein [Deinococcus sp.]|uniref:hypothetical protein n=1 Tax=Deinococcus sp. TaxID=47478 RepID=UPI003CC64FA8